MSKVNHRADVEISPEARLHESRLVFWDFDGVIKDSIEVKSEGFERLFTPYGSELAKRVRKHHEAHGGMSRYDKLPLYLQWVGEEPTESRVNKLCEQFGQLVLQGVIDAPWVGGVEAYLRGNPHQQVFILISATPQEELEQILRALDLTECFVEIFGAPVRKQDAIKMTLAARELNPRDCLMVGDARADFEAAEANQVPFLLRKHATNASVFADYTGVSVKDFVAL